MSVTTCSREMLDAVREVIKVPDRVERAAEAVRTDLLHGPAWCIVDADGDIVDTYQWREDAAENCLTGDRVESAYDYAGGILREYIDKMPSVVYEPWSGYVFTGAIDFDELDNELLELDRRVIIAALFGETISRNFW